MLESIVAHSLGTNLTFIIEIREIREHKIATK